MEYSSLLYKVANNLSTLLIFLCSGANGKSLCISCNLCGYSKSTSN